MNVNDAHNYLDEHREEYISLLKKLVNIPSVSSDRAAAVECAKTLKELLEDTGFETKIIETPGNPLVYGHVESKTLGQRTILFYGHYDVQPAAPINKWLSDPFKSEIRDGRIYGRGVADNKGQFLTHIMAVKACLAVMKDVPVNVKIILDGEEEIGSGNLPQAVKGNQELFKADLVYTSDGGMDAGDVQTVTFGVRGVMNFDMELKTASTDNHSGNKGGVIENAAWEMVRILGKMIDSQGRAAIPGFYDDVKAPDEYDWELIDRLSFDREKLASAFGVKALTADSKKEYYTRLMFEPTLTVNGLYSGHTGTGSKNIIPCSATAKMEVRLVDAQDPEDIMSKIRKYVSSINTDVQIIKVEDDMRPSRSKASTPILKEVAATIKRYLGKVKLLPVGGGSLPDYVWTGIMGIPSILVPYGNIDESNHAPNENLKSDLFQRGMHVSLQVMSDLGAACGKR